MSGYSPVTGRGKQKTDVHCHQCNKNFVAELDFDLDGDHVIECAYCGHEHYRKIKNGEITEIRWNSQIDNNCHRAKSVWKTSVLKIQTSTVSQFIRDLWLNRSDL